MLLRSKQRQGNQESSGSRWWWRVQTFPTFLKSEAVYAHHVRATCPPVSWVCSKCTLLCNSGYLGGFFCLINPHHELMWDPQRTTTNLYWFASLRDVAIISGLMTLCFISPQQLCQPQKYCREQERLPGKIINTALIRRTWQQSPPWVVLGVMWAKSEFLASSGWSTPCTHQDISRLIFPGVLLGISPAFKQCLSVMYRGLQLVRKSQTVELHTSRQPNTHSHEQIQLLNIPYQSH